MANKTWRSLCPSTPSETLQEKFNRKLNKVLEDAKKAWVSTLNDDYEKKISWLEADLKFKKDLIRRLETKNQWLETENYRFKDEIDLLSYENSCKSKQVEMLKWELDNDKVDTNNDHEDLWLSSFNEFPRWNEKKLKEQTKIFTDLLKSEKLVSVEDGWVFYKISFNIPWFVIENIYCSKDSALSEFKYFWGKAFYASDYTREMLKKIYSELPWWIDMLSKDAIVRFSKKLLPLYDRLWINQINRNFSDDNYPKVWDESVFAFFIFIISNLVPERSSWYFWLKDVSEESPSWAWSHQETNCYLSSDVWGAPDWLHTGANWEDWQFLFIDKLS